MLRFDVLIEEGLGDDDNHPVKASVWVASEFAKRDPDFKKKYLEMNRQGVKLRLKIIGYSSDASKEIEEFGDDLLKADSPYAIYSMNNQQKL